MRQRRGEFAWDAERGCLALGVGSGRPGLHAPRQRLADDVWLAMIPITYATGWLNSVVYVSALSLWALVSGHWSAWQAARVEVAQQKEMQRQQENPIEEKVVEKIVEQTNVQRDPAAA